MHEQSAAGKVQGTWNDSSRERKFHGTNGPGNECSKERMVSRTKVPSWERMFQGTNSLGNEYSWYLFHSRIFHVFSPALPHYQHLAKQQLLPYSMAQAYCMHATGVGRGWGAWGTFYLTVQQPMADMRRPVTRPLPRHNDVKWAVLRVMRILAWPDPCTDPSIDVFEKAVCPLIKHSLKNEDSANNSQCKSWRSPEKSIVNKVHSRHVYSV